MENHAADHFFGCMDLPGFDGIIGHTIPKPGGGTVEVTCGKADYVCKLGPGYSTFDGKFPPIGGSPIFLVHPSRFSDKKQQGGWMEVGEGGVRWTPIFLV